MASTTSSSFAIELQEQPFHGSSHPHPSVSGLSSGATTRESSPSRDPSFRTQDRHRRSALSNREGAGGLSRWQRLSRWRKDEGQCFCDIAGSCATVLLVGMNDTATGSNIPSMQETYDVSYRIISLVFLANTFGYFVSSISSSFLFHHYGLKKSLFVAGSFYGAGSIVLSVRPPFPVMTLGLALLGFGSGLYDSCLTTVVAHYERSALMSAMYSCFGVGAFISPFIIGSLVDKGVPWNYYYFVPLALSVLLAVLHNFLFDSYELPADEVTAPATSHNAGSLEASSIHAAPSNLSPRQRLKATMAFPLVWLGAALVVLGFASTDTLGSWLPSYLLTVKGAPEARSRYELAALWGGIALGRVVLSPITSYFGEKLASIGFLSAVIAGLGVLWGVGNLAAGTAMVFISGFFLGPVTPSVIAVTTARVPPSLKSSVVGILIGLGLIGSALGPLFVGIAAETTGLAMLPGVMIVLCVLSIVGLIGVKTKKRED